MVGGDGGVCWRGDVCWRRKHARCLPLFSSLKKGWLETVMRGVVGQGLRAWVSSPAQPP